MARERTILALDPGTTQTCALVVRIADGIPNLIGAGRALSVGIRRGAIADLQSAAASIAQAAQDACRTAGVRCDRVWAAVCDEHLKGLPARAEIKLVGAEVRQRDLDACLRQAVTAAPLGEGEEILHALPGEFAVDGRPGISSPLGMAGQRLQVDAFLVTASSAAVDNLERCIESAGLTLENEVLSSLAAAWAATEEAERQAGVLVVDIGAGTADFIAFRAGRVALVGCLNIAGAHVTRDIAAGMRVSVGEAERLKREQAAALASLVPASEIRLASGERAERWFLAEVVEARMREIFELVHARVKQAGLTPRLAVLTGGEARLAGSAQLAEEIFACPARVGCALPLRAAITRDPSWAVAVGIARYAAQQRPRSAPAPRGPLARGLRWVRESFK